MSVSRPDLGLGIRGAVGPEGEFGDALALASEAGFGGLLAASIFELSPTLDEKELAELRAIAADHDRTVVAGLPYLHPFRVGADASLREAGDGDAVRGLHRAIEEAARFDSPDLPFVLGYIEDRLDPMVPWREQLDAAAALFTRLAPCLREHGARLCIKTHEEITTFEIVELVERVGPDVLSVGFDPVNVVLRCEDPLAAARRIVPYTAHVYVDDCTLTAEGRAFRRWLTTPVDGALDWPALAATVRAARPDARFWVDLHKGQFTIEPYAPDWLAAMPDLDPDEYAAVLGLAVREDARWTGADRDRLAAAQSCPRDRLPAAIAGLTELLRP